MQWKAIGDYRVYEDGTIVSGRGKTMKPRPNPRGYHRIVLRVDKKPQDWLIHRLVATLFIPNPDNKPQVDHIDGNKANNAVSNLRWVTAMENYHNPNTVKNHIKYDNPLRPHTERKTIRGKTYVYTTWKLSRRHI